MKWWPSSFPTRPAKMEVFVRHCLFSPISQHKLRFDRFSREACHRNLTSTFDSERGNLTLFLDRQRGGSHFLDEETRYPRVDIAAGTEAGSFLSLLDHVEARHFSPDTLLYFVEDDYIHRPGWMEVLLEAFSLPGVEYATLYDHRDKYTQIYAGLQSEIFATASCHWRTIPSTTQTFATRWKTLQRDLPVHRQFSSQREISDDHQKFLSLTTKGVRLVSPLPGWSTHAEPPFASPCIDWEALLHSTQEVL